VVGGRTRTATAVAVAADRTGGMVTDPTTRTRRTDGRTWMDWIARRHGMARSSCPYVRDRPLLRRARCCLLPRHSFSSEPRDLFLAFRNQNKRGCVALRAVRVATCRASAAWQGGHSRPARTCIAFHAVSTSSHTVSLAPREARCSDLSTQNGIKRVITQSAGRTSRSLIPVFTRKIWAVRSEALLRPYFILSTQGGRGTVCSHVLYCTYASWASSVCECWLRSIQHSYHQSIV
jgi:hypothetical protein